MKDANSQVPDEVPGTGASSSPERLPSFSVPDEFRTRWDDEADRVDAELEAEFEQSRRERQERAKLPPPPPVPLLTLHGDAHPERVAEELVRFYGVALARQIREGLVVKLRFFKNRPSATWDLVQDDLLASRPAAIE